MNTTRVEVEVAKPYTVHIGRGVIASLPKPGEQVAILTDTNVAPHHAHRLKAIRARTQVELFPGETSKSFTTLERILDELSAARLDRSSVLIALGGGVVGDLGGLAASLYMRGIDLVHCPTSLLAMIDSSVGGKTAVNLASGKNLAGTYWQPRAVYADIDTLGTLPIEELRSGLGEAVKSALIGDAELLEWLAKQGTRVLAGEPDTLQELVLRCVRVKARIVAADEREAELRQSLNLGHTFAHAIEQVAGYGTVSHGIAVGVGLVLALEASRQIELLEDHELLDRVRGVLGALGLPGDLDELRERSGRSLEAKDLIQAMRSDKKSEDGEPRFVLIRRAEAVQLGARLEPELLEALLTRRSPGHMFQSPD